MKAGRTAESPASRDDPTLEFPAALADDVEAQQEGVAMKAAPSLAIGRRRRESGGRRERLERLAERVRATGARFIVVYHLDRFARDLAGTLDYLRRFARRGVELHVVGRGRVEADTATGFIVTAVEGLAAEHYRRVIAEKTRDALARLRAQGRRISRWAPYGFRLAPGGRVVVDPREQAVLAQIAALHAGGLSRPPGLPDWPGLKGRPGTRPPAALLLL